MFSPCRENGWCTLALCLVGTSHKRSWITSRSCECEIALKQAPHISKPTKTPSPTWDDSPVLQRHSGADSVSAWGNLVGVKMVQSPTAAADPRLQERQVPICLCANVRPSVASALAPLLFRTGLWSRQEWRKPLRQQHLKNAMLLNWPAIQLFLLLYMLLLWR